MNQNITLKSLTDFFCEFALNIPRATVVGAIHYANRPLEKKRLALAGATLGAATFGGLAAAFGVAAVGLFAGGLTVQSFALPICGVHRKNPNEPLGTIEALEHVNKGRAYEGRAPLNFPKINL